jgi:putative FmdB family regulatory protein
VPFYDYACQACGVRFEELIRVGINDEGDPPCPACEGLEVKRLPSTFAVGRAPVRRPTAPPPGACEGCPNVRGPGACHP